MARAATKLERSDDLLPDPVVETLTYVPQEPTDPSRVVWGGHTFLANVPKELRGHADGTEQERLNLHLIDSARGNPSFMVGNQPAKRDARSRTPKTPEEYRAYIADWLKRSSEPDSDIRSADELITRFAREKALQEACGLGTDDWAMIGELFMPKLHWFQKHDELSDANVAAIWVRNGINQLPW